MTTEALSPATFFPLADPNNDTDRSEQQRGVLPLPAKPKDDEPSIFADRVWSGVSQVMTTTAKKEHAAVKVP